MITSRFVISGTAYEYRTDVLRLEWEADRDDFTRVDLVEEVDYRSQRALITFETVFEAANSNAQGVSAAGLFEKIRNATAAGNTVTFVPEIDFTGAPHTNPPEVDVLTEGSPPTAYQTEQSTERLQRSLRLKSKKWLDPSVTADQNVIDDLNALTTVL